MGGVERTHHVPPFSILAPSIVLLHLPHHVRFPESTELPERESGVVGVPNEVHRRDSAWQEVEDGDGDDLAVEFVERMEGAVRMTWRLCGFDLQDEC